MDTRIYGNITLIIRENNPVPQAGRLLVDRTRPSPLCTPRLCIFPVLVVDVPVVWKYKLLAVLYIRVNKFFTAELALALDEC